MTASEAMRTAVIEGSLREVALADVLQLLEMGRKTGILRVHDPIGRRDATVTLLAGRIADASIDDGRARAADVREAMIELLTWTSGRFAVEPTDAPPGRARLGLLGVDSVLMEAARRADEWERLADRVPGPDAAPRLATPGDGAGSPLALAPDEWQVLAYADGAADLRVLAARTGRDVLTVARAVHRLIGEGFLTLAEMGSDSNSAEMESDPISVPTDRRRSSDV